MRTQEFQTAVNCQSRPPAHEPDLIAVVDGLAGRITDATRKAMEIGLSGDEISGLRHRLRHEAEVRWMRTRYATLDLSFMDGETNRKQFVIGRTDAAPDQVELKKVLAPGEEVEHTKTCTVAALPVFVCEWMTFSQLREHFTPTQRDGWRVPFPEHRLRDHFHLPAVRLHGVHYRALAVTARVKMPEGITPDMFARVRRCIAFLELFDVLLLDRDMCEVPAHRRGHRTGDIEVGVLWAPVEEAWAFSTVPPRPAGDPAVVVRSGGTSYLVGYFDTPDEKPIDNLIREFSTGPLGSWKAPA